MLKPEYSGYRPYIPDRLPPVELPGIRFIPRRMGQIGLFPFMPETCGQVVSLDALTGFAVYCTLPLGHLQDANHGHEFNPAETTSLNGWVGNR